MTAENLERAAPLAARKLPRWEELPDLDLYMDQVLSLVHRYLGVDEAAEGKVLTSSMVNNYVKLHIMPAPEKKKYTRMHLAYLLAICVLKSSLPMTAIQDLLQRGMAEHSPEDLYNMFCELYERTGRETVEAHRAPGQSESSVILHAALRAQAEQTLARILAGSDGTDPR